MDDTEQGAASSVSNDPNTEPARSVDKTDDIVVDDGANDDGDEEEALFVAMEKDEESKDALRTHPQPKDVKAAPKLLQSAIEQGQVNPDDSESDSEQVGSTIADSEPHHAHARV
jgi:hypothetical protein